MGRLVERPAQMTAVIRDFLGRGGVTLESSLLAGYDFMQDGLTATEPTLAQALPPERRTRLIGSDWSAGLLESTLLGGARHDLFVFALHASHFFMETPNNGILFADQIAQNKADLAGMLVIGLACHAGLNVPGLDHGRPVDLPEVWQGKGSSFIGSTGWAYGGAKTTGVCATRRC